METPPILRDRRPLRIILLTVGLLPLLSNCTTAPRQSMSPAEFGGSIMADRMQARIESIERSEPAAWRDLSAPAYRVDGVQGEIFGVTCAHLVRRDPTIFLRRYLAGDPNAACCAWNAYWWGSSYQRVFDDVHRFRLLEARTTEERQRIEKFLSLVHDEDNMPPPPAAKRTTGLSSGEVPVSDTPMDYRGHQTNPSPRFDLPFAA